MAVTTSSVIKKPENAAVKSCYRVEGMHKEMSLLRNTLPCHHRKEKEKGQDLHINFFFCFESHFYLQSVAIH
jgi:hypothetical protein